METYSVELAAALERDFDVTRLVLPGRVDGRPPNLMSYGLFLLRAMLYCLFLGRRFSHLVLGDLILFPAAILCRFVRKDQQRVVVVYGLDLVYGRRQGFLSKCYALYLSGFRACQGLFVRVVAISRYTAQLGKDSGLRYVAVVNPSLPSSALTSPAEKGTEFPRRSRVRSGASFSLDGWFPGKVRSGLPRTSYLCCQRKPNFSSWGRLMAIRNLLIWRPANGPVTWARCLRRRWLPWFVRQMLL